VHDALSLITFVGRSWPICSSYSDFSSCLTLYPLSSCLFTSLFVFIHDPLIVSSCLDEHINAMPVYQLALLLASVALAMPTTPNNLYNPKKLFARGGPTIQATDPFDRRWIEALAAVGDSFSVGLGAGHAVKATGKVQRSTSDPDILC